MAQLLVRDLEDAVVQALRQKAAEEGTSVEEAHRRILRCASRALSRCNLYWCRKEDWRPASLIRDYPSLIGFKYHLRP
jgi:hypothetical protein